MYTGLTAPLINQNLSFNREFIKTKTPRL